jgi:outer membrane murein-binding lipoprotein Lpp
MTSRGVLVLISAVIVSAALPGCRGMDIFQQGKKIKQLTADLESACADAKTAQQAVFEARSELARKQKRIDTLVSLGPDRIKKLYYVRSIKLGQYTGGADLNGQPGDDGIKVFLRPIDSNGDTIKAAGAVTVQVYDLAQPADKTLIGEYKWSVDEVAKAFSGGFMTYHFTFTCPWKSGPPKHAGITVRVEFIDYLTGKTMSAQKVCKVNLPAP